MRIPWRRTDFIFTVGIDIDVNNINLVALKRTSASPPIFELLSYAHKTTTSELPLVSEAIKNALQQMGVNKNSRIVVALPCGQVLTKTLRLDDQYNDVRRHSGLAKLEARIANYCQGIINYPIHEACMDFELDSDGSLRIAIAKRHAVEEKINLFVGSNFKVAAVDVESDALARCINYALCQSKEGKAQKINIALHMASQKILGIVFCREKVLFSQEVPLDITDPEGIKAECYLEKIKILLPVLSFYEKNFINSKQIYISNDIYLSGMGIVVKSIINNIKNITNKNPCFFNPFFIFDKHIKNNSSGLAISLGLAMREFKNEC